MTASVVRYMDCFTGSFRGNYFSSCKFGERLESKFNQNIATRAACIGLTIGWPEISSNFYIVNRYSNGTCCLNAENVKSTTRLLFNSGSCIGALLPTFFVDFAEHKHNFIASAYLNLVFWVTFIFTEDYSFYLVGTAIGGLSTGSFAVTTAIYITEITPPNTHSKVGTLVAFFAYSGIFLGTSLSVYIHNRVAPLIICLLTAGFILLVDLLMIESPFLLYQHGKTLDAKLALKSLRGVKNYLEIDSEYKAIEDSIKSKFSIARSIPSSILNHEYLSRKIIGIKGRTWTLWIMFFLFLSQLIGSYALEEFTTNFIEQIYPYVGTILLSFLDLCSILVCLYLAEKIGKKNVIIISISVMSFSCFLFTMDTMINKLNDKLLAANTRVFPFIIIFLYCCSYSLGITPILPLLMSQRGCFSNRARTIVIGLSISSLYFIKIINQCIFELSDIESSTFSAFTVFAIIGSLGLFIVFILLPLTATEIDRIDDGVIIM